MSNFLDDCGPIQHKEGSNGAYNDQYNQWEENCLKKIVDKYKGEYPAIFQWLQNSSTGLEKTAHKDKVESTSSFSQNETIGIGTAAAVGGSVAGAGGLYLIPMGFRWLTRFFG